MLTISMSTMFLSTLGEHGRHGVSGRGCVIPTSSSESFSSPLKGWERLREEYRICDRQTEV